MPLSAAELADLVDRHAAALRLWAGHCPSPDDAVQEAFCRLVTLEPRPERPAAWLYRAVRNAAASQARSHGRRRRHEQSASIKEPYENDPAAGLVRREVLAIVAELDDDLRHVLVARIWGELTIEETADLCGISPATVFRRYREALARIRRKLGVSCLNTID